MESRLRLGAVLGGLPRPAVNEPLFAGGRFVARPDLLLAQARLGLEHDGAEHRKDSRRSRDRRRERRTVRELDILLMSFDVTDLRDPLGLRDELVQLYETRSGLVLPRPLPVPPRLLPC